MNPDEIIKWLQALPKGGTVYVEGDDLGYTEAPGAYLHLGGNPNPDPE